MKDSRNEQNEQISITVKLMIEPLNKMNE